MQLFEFCLAPDTSGDGTGCDNMTCVIVKFNKHHGGSGGGMELGRVGGEVKVDRVVEVKVDGEKDGGKGDAENNGEKNEEVVKDEGKKNEDVEKDIVKKIEGGVKEKDAEVVKEKDVVKNGGVNLRREREEGRCVDGVGGSEAKKFKSHAQPNDEIAM